MCSDPLVMTLPAFPPAPCQFSYLTVSAKEEGGLQIKFLVFLSLDFLQAQLSSQSSHFALSRADVNCLSERAAFLLCSPSTGCWLLISGLSENQPQA